MPRKKKIEENHYRTHLNKLKVPKVILKFVDDTIKKLVNNNDFSRFRPTS